MAPRQGEPLPALGEGAVRVEMAAGLVLTAVEFDPTNLTSRPEGRRKAPQPKRLC